MENLVTIDIVPVILNAKKKSSSTWQTKLRIAQEDLEFSATSIRRLLETEIPVHFTYPLHLTLSYNMNSMKVKIDYSAIKEKKGVSLIKLYLKNEHVSFSKEWLKLAS